MIFLAYNLVLKAIPQQIDKFLATGLGQSKIGQGEGQYSACCQLIHNDQIVFPDVSRGNSSDGEKTYWNRWLW